MDPIPKRLFGLVAASLTATAESKLQSWPMERSLAFGASVGRALHRLGARRRHRAEENIAMVFPEMGDRAVRSLAKASFVHFGTVAADFLAGSRRGIEEVDALTSQHGLNHLDDALSLGKGALIVTGHMGHWERGAQWLSLHGYPLTAIARDANDEGVNRIVNDARRASGTEILSRGDSAAVTLRRLRDNRAIAILADQNAEDAFLPFLGRMAGVNLGVGVIAARTGAPVLPSCAYYLGNGRVVGEIGPPLQALPDEAGRGSGMMLAFHRYFETCILREPGQWLWFHNRWRYAREAGLR
ncbi:MAG: lysophospholipid acyltransferase family protein [Fimbriimonadaceae bacterium]|nr:lysophospholipid acyltransferase family protein [Fimbriimonadaceae bacterium]